MAADNKKAALEAAMKNIEKRFGAGAVMRLGQNSSLKVDAISTGSLTLDIATGIGGLPRGRIVEIYGPESSGKTTLALHCIAEAQKLGGDAAFIDAEHALDPEYAANLGVDIDSLIVAQPDFGEQALEITENLVQSREEIHKKEEGIQELKNAAQECLLKEEQYGSQRAQWQSDPSSRCSCVRCCIVFCDSADRSGV